MPQFFRRPPLRFRGVGGHYDAVVACAVVKENMRGSNSRVKFLFLGVLRAIRPIDLDAKAVDAVLLFIQGQGDFLFPLPCGQPLGRCIVVGFQRPHGKTNGLGKGFPSSAQVGTIQFGGAIFQVAHLGELDAPGGVLAVQGRESR